MSERSCKTCRFLFVVPDRVGRRVVRKANVYRCRAPIPDMPADMPASLTKGDWRWKWPGDKQKSRMSGSEGTDCGAWQKWEKPDA